MEWNSNIIDNVATRAALKNSLEFGKIIISCPASAESGDRKIAGSSNVIGAARYQNKWRPAGLGGTWPTQPTTTQVPFVANTPVLFEWTVNSCSVSIPSLGYSYSTNYTPGNIFVSGNTARFGVCHWTGDNSPAVLAGTRFYNAAISFSHPTYGFAWDFVPCIKDGIPYICDRISKMLIPQTGSGTITVGPKVPDNYSAI